MEGRLRWFSWLVFVLTLFVLGSSISYSMGAVWPANARIFPTAAGILGMLLILIELAIPYVPFLKKRLAVKSVMDLVTEEDETGSVTDIGRKASFALFWLFGLFAGIYLFGFHISYAIFLASYFIFAGRVGLLRSLILTAIVWAIIFVGVNHVLHIPWPEPLLAKF